MSLHCLVLLSVCCLLWHDVTGYGAGAPVAQCTAMQPSVSEHGAVAQNGASPYTMTVSSNQVNGDESITVTINATSGDFRGILLQARVKDQDTIVGTFGTPPANFQLLNCNSSNGNAVTHANGNDKGVPQFFSWMAPNDADQEIEFLATIVQVKNTYWVQQKSDSVTVNQVTPDMSTSSSDMDDETTMNNQETTTSQATSVIQPVVTMLLMACSAIVYFLLK